MTIVAALLLALTAGEALPDRLRHHSPWAAPATAVLTVLAVLVLAGVGGTAAVILGALAAAAAVGWFLTQQRSDATHAGHLVPLTILGIGLAVLVAGAGAVPATGGVIGSWMEHGAPQRLRVISAQQLLVTVAVFAVQAGPGNRIVRSVLFAVGALRPSGQPQPADRLRGGRLLGPLERLLILGLALAGQVAAAGLVTAAKGLVRFPELNAQRGPGREVNGVGIDQMTEYFLIGSFVSWLVALTGVGLVALA
ncbi:hypothetical protein ACMYYO_05625 [Dermacoccaceae bacterium W4C1]